jgi:3-methyladenine DNA glycosylase AlkD
MLNKLKQDLEKLANKEKIQNYQRFFKTGPGQYGEGDIFMGLTVPKQRSVAKSYLNLDLSDIQSLLNSKIHEHRLVALLILVEQYKQTKNKEIVDFYLANTKNINNWDLVDSTAHKILGDYLIDKNRSILYKLVKSKSLWERRISIISTFAFIPNNDFNDSLKLAKILLKDTHDLIHKAVGWVLREVGKKDQNLLENFLKKHYDNLPRTTLRYAIEKFEETKRQSYLKKKLND